TSEGEGVKGRRGEKTRVVFSPLHPFTPSPLDGTGGTMPDDNALIAYALHSNQSDDVFPIPAAIARPWMDSAHQRHPYRCLPLVIANQSGWTLHSPVGFRAYWYGGPAKEDVELQFEQPDNRVVSHFGSGVITFTIPFLFRTPPGINLWVKGPANWVEDGVQALQGVGERDWRASTLTMNWKMTRSNEWVHFEKGEPFCMLVPVPRGLVENLVPRVELLSTNPELEAQYKHWESSRSGFLDGLH